MTIRVPAVVKELNDKYLVSGDSSVRLVLIIEDPAFNSEARKLKSGDHVTIEAA